MQFVNGMNTSYVQIRNELASEQLIKVQFQVAMSGRYREQDYKLNYMYLRSMCDRIRPFNIDQFGLENFVQSKLTAPN